MKFGEQKTNCCAQCPFARSTPKEYLDTRGDNGEAFLGQAHTNALLPCHMANVDAVADPTTGQCQCAGAAKFRSNVGVANHRSPLGQLPPDADTVFSSAAELLAHHKGWSLEKAMLYILEEKPIRQMVIDEIIKAAKLGRVEITGSHR